MRYSMKDLRPEVADPYSLMGGLSERPAFFTIKGWTRPYRIGEALDDQTQRINGGQGRNRTTDTGIFSSLYCATLVHLT